MGRQDAALVLGIAGFLLGGVGAYVGTSARDELADYRAGTDEAMQLDNESLGALGDKVRAAEESLQSLTRRVNGLSADPNRLWEKVNVIEARLAALEQAAGVARPAGAGTGAAAPGQPSKLSREELKALQEKVLSGKATTEEAERFWDAVKDPELLKGVIDELEKKVADAPRDVDARMRLGRAYLTKLFSASYGPEMGFWAGKAEEQWSAVLEQDPGHWEARYSLGMSYSNYPDFLNKRADAIREFETLRRTQEQQAPRPEHANTYLQLHLLYIKQGKLDAAKESLDEGLRRFPDDEDLQKARDAAK